MQAWGIDYLKYDLCDFREIMKHADSPAAANKMMVDAYITMRDALRKTGRPIVYSFCQYGDDAVWRWAASAGGNLWRTTGDINDTYPRMAAIGFGQAGLAKFAGPSHWNDPDMLEIGNGGMNLDEYRTHMSLWALLAAPRLAGTDLSAMSPETVALLTNKEVCWPLTRIPRESRAAGFPRRVPWKFGCGRSLIVQKQWDFSIGIPGLWICKSISANWDSREL